jgi:hypothetical protein
MKLQELFRKYLVWADREYGKPMSLNEFEHQLIKRELFPAAYGINWESIFYEMHYAELVQLVV